MRYLALATDYDATLATDGRVGAATLASLVALRDAGLRRLLVTGRRLEDLQDVFREIDVLDAVVAENGALLWSPGGEPRPLAPPPPPELGALLRRRGVPFVAGRVVVATWDPHGPAVRQAVRDLGAPLVATQNHDAVMWLPPGVDKGSGLAAALRELGVAPRQVVAVGDAENDEALLRAVGCGAAVANALPSLRARADVVTGGARGAGVEELVRRLLAGDLPAPRA